MIVTEDNKCPCQSDIRLKVQYYERLLQKHTMAQGNGSSVLICTAQINAGPPGVADATCLDIEPTFSYGNGTSGG